MTPQSTGAKTDSTSIPSVEETTERIRALNEKILEAGKSAGGAWLDAYEKSLKNLLDFENKAAGASQLDWLTAMSKAHTDFVTDLTSAYTKAARELIK